MRGVSKWIELTLELFIEWKYILAKLFGAYTSLQLTHVSHQLQMNTIFICSVQYSKWRNENPETRVCFHVQIVEEPTNTNVTWKHIWNTSVEFLASSSVKFATKHLLSKGRINRIWVSNIRLFCVEMDLPKTVFTH